MDITRNGDTFALANITAPELLAIQQMFTDQVDALKEMLGDPNYNDHGGLKRWLRKWESNEALLKGYNQVLTNQATTTSASREGD